MKRYLAFPTPKNGLGSEIRGYTQRIKIPYADTPGAFAVGSFLKASSNGHIPLAAVTDDPSFQVIAIYDQYGNHLPFQYVSATDAQAADHLVDVIPVGGVIYEATEDALVTPITTANANANVYISLASVTTFSSTTENVVNPYGGALPTMLLDSSLANASKGTNPIQLLGVSPAADVPAYSATASASPRTFLFKWTDPGASI